MAKFKKYSPSKTAKRVIGDKLEITDKQHTELVQFCTERLDFGKEHRDKQAERYARIDREIAGELMLEREDRKRKNDTDRGKGIKPYDTSLPLTTIQLGDAVTDLLAILVQEDGLYSAIATQEKQEAANSLVSVMNKHADLFAHIRQMNLSLNHMLRYNFGGNIVEWEKVIGNRIKNSQNGTTLEVERNVVVKQGNSMPAIDPYNFIYDWTVAAPDLPLQGEFFATVDAVMPFRLKKMKMQGKLHGDIQKYIDSKLANGFESRYFRMRPDLRINSDGVAQTDFVSILSMGAKTTLGAAAELVYLYTWIEPKKYGLSSDVDDLEIWRLALLNGEVIVDAELLNNAHGMLPCAIGMPLEDGFRNQTHSYGEMLLPFQRFASAQMNAHQRATRKRLVGVTYYNQRLFPDLDKTKEDLYAARVPFLPPQDNDNFDIHRHIYKDYDAPDTSGTVNDINSMVEFMNHILPSKQVGMVADLERATKYQAAATVQGTNKGNWHKAKLIDIMHLTPLRFMMYYNVLQYQDAVELLDDKGQTVSIDPAAMRETQLEFSVAEGIKALDKMIIAENMKEVIRWMLQSAEAMQRYDIGLIIDHWTSIQGDKTDFNQYKIKHAIDALSPQEKDQVYQVYQQLVAQQQAAAGGKK